MATPFELATADLGLGMKLVEASAGTGKTYALAGLVLRLVVEAGLPVRGILTVTFTQASTAELRIRIRRRLVEALEAFDTGRSEDPLLRHLLARKDLDRSQSRQRLRSALLEFDEAPIHTIHAFCQSVLEDHTFETGQALGRRLEPDARPMVEAVARDWWRRTLYAASPIRALAALDAGLSIEALAEQHLEFERRPGATCVSDASGAGLEADAHELERRWESLVEAWRVGRPQLEGLFHPPGNAWAKGGLGKPEAMRIVLDRIEAMTRGDGAGSASLDPLRVLRRDSIQANTRAKKTSPGHPFFGCCDEVLAAAKIHAAALVQDFLREAKERLPALADARNLWTYPSLLSDVAAALRGPRGRALADALAARFPAVLIDEFQDTDPLQLEIFRTAFGEGRSRLWMVGDPKQAIYGFRGADVFTYLEARGEVEETGRCSLPRNHRSDSRLVEAVNQLFGFTGSFVVDGIAYEPVEASGKVDARRLEDGCLERAPFNLWAWSPPGSLEALWELLAPAVAGEIWRLLSDHVTIGVEREGHIERRRLAASDIAVLVEEHRHGERMARCLEELGIATSRHSMESVFDTDEALELRLVLLAIAAPSDERRARAAAGTRLLGENAPGIQDLLAHEARWNLRLERLHEYRRLWADEGFGPMFRALLRQEEIASRWLARAEGARRWTNLLHLGGLLEQAADEGHLHVRGLLRWVEARLATQGAKPEDHLLRIERDDDAVHILTAHSSKGLQWPVVFCPYLQRPAIPSKNGPRRKEVVLHHPFHGKALACLDLKECPDPNGLQRSRRERLAESVRLSYVALTRAEHRCYLAWAHREKDGSGGPAWFLLRPGKVDDTAAATLETAVTTTPTATFLQQLQTLPAVSSGAIAIVGELPVWHPAGTSRTEVDPTGDARTDGWRPLTAARPLPRTWGITSFTALSSHSNARASDRLDPALAEQRSDLPPVEDPLCAFRAGARLGECVHEIFEAWMNPERGADSLENLAGRKLRKHGMKVEDGPGILTEVLRRALDADLRDSERAAFRLGAVEPGDRLVEVKFHLPLRTITPMRLAECFRGPGVSVGLDGLGDELGSLRFSRREGYLTGAIDLIVRVGGRFHLVDWKTNRLPDYSPVGLQRAMLAQHYGLQYHLYALALDRFLASRVPGYDYERHFGGIHYLFLRGIGPRAPGMGVFHDRPTGSLMQRLHAALLPTPTEADP